jgi:hypothetical protein
MNLAEFETEQRRLAILRVLAGDRDFEANEDLLRAAMEQVGLAVAADDLRADLQHLRSQVCVTCREVGDLWVVKITQRGWDVSRGLISATGVAKPRPGSV